MDKQHGNTGNNHARKNESGTMTSVINFRALPDNKTAWVRQAQAEGKKLSVWITEKLNAS